MTIGTRVRILDATNIHYLDTATVVAVTPSGRVQTVSDVDGTLDIFSRTDLAPFSA